MSHLSRALEFALSQTWAMEEGFHRRMMQVLVRHGAGVKLTEEEIAAATGSDMPKRASEMRVEKGTAIIPIHGVIAHRAAAVGRLSSRVGTSVEHIRADLNAALEDPAVQSILLEVDSHGGSVAGIESLASDIRAARKLKPIVAHTDGMMASAGYWLASQADQVFATKDALVGSIGVIASFYDTHRAAANEGFDQVVVKSTPGKGGVQSNGTLSDADRADIQREVDAYHAMFVEAVAAGRGVDAARAGAMADGRVYMGADAIDRGYLDGVQNVAASLRTVRGLARQRAAAAGIEDLPEARGAEGTNQTENETMTKTEEKAAPAAGADTKSTAAAAPAPSATEIAAEAARIERARVSGILEASADAQRELRQKLIADGTPLPDALAALNKDLLARLEQAKVLPSASSKSMAGGNDSDVASKPKADAKIQAMPQGEERWKAEFAASPELQSEFGGDIGLYIGAMKNERNLAAASRRPD